MRTFTLIVYAALMGFVSTAQATASGENFFKDENGCLVFDPHHEPNERYRWNGACVNGYAEGDGTLQDTQSAGQTLEQGKMVRGKLEGWVRNSKEGQLESEGEYKDGTADGRVIMYFHQPDSRLEFESFRDGKANGRVIRYLPDGKRLESFYKDNVRIGNYVLYYPDGDRYEGDFNNPKKMVPNGHGTLYSPDGTRSEGEFKDGNLIGLAKIYLTDGSRIEAQVTRDSSLNAVVSHAVRFDKSGASSQVEFKNGKWVAVGPASSSQATGATNTGSAPANTQQSLWAWCAATIVNWKGTPDNPNFPHPDAGYSSGHQDVSPLFLFPFSLQDWYARQSRYVENMAAWVRQQHPLHGEVGGWCSTPYESKERAEKEYEDLKTGPASRMRHFVDHVPNPY